MPSHCSLVTLYIYIYVYIYININLCVYKPSRRLRVFDLSTASLVSMAYILRSETDMFYVLRLSVYD
jgi:hypothetical protein